MNARPIHWQTWELAEDADQRFRRIVLFTALPLLLLAIAIPFLDLIGLTRGGSVESQRRYVDLLPSAVEPATEEIPETPQPEAAKPPVTEQQRLDQARQTAARTGVMAFANQLASLRDSTLTGLDQPQNLRSTDGLSRSGEIAGSAIAESAQGSSGGISVAQRSAEASTQLSERQQTRVDAPLSTAPAANQSGQGGDKRIAGREIQEIQLVFNRNQAAIIAIFNRAQRDNPNLRGRILINFTVQPDGSITDLELVRSELGDPALEKRLLARIALINFGAKTVPPYPVRNYPITLL